MQICVWFHDGGEIDGADYEPGWYWDDAEDHGGWDRISPTGPYEDTATAESDARAVYDNVEFVLAVPDHYPRKGALQ